MGLFEKLSISLGGKKKSAVSFLPSPTEPVIVYKNSIKCSSYPYKTLAKFDLNLSKPKYDGDIPDATIKFYPLD